MVCAAAGMVVVLARGCAAAEKGLAGCGRSVLRGGGGVGCAAETFCVRGGNVLRGDRSVGCAAETFCAATGVLRGGNVLRARRNRLARRQGCWVRGENVLRGGKSVGCAAGQLPMVCAATGRLVCLAVAARARAGTAWRPRDRGGSLVMVTVIVSYRVGHSDFVRT